MDWTRVFCWLSGHPYVLYGYIRIYLRNFRQVHILATKKKTSITPQRFVNFRCTLFCAHYNYFFQFDRFPPYETFHFTWPNIFTTMSAHTHIAHRYSTHTPATNRQTRARRILCRIFFSLASCTHAHRNFINILSNRFVKFGT